MTVDTAPKRFGSWRAVKRALVLLNRAPLKFLLWSVAFAGLPDLATTYATTRFSSPETAFTTLNGWLLMVATMLVSMFGLVALQAVITRDVAADYDGSPNSGQARFGGVSDYLALAALGLVTSLGIIGGFILLVIPGVILSLAWLVVVPVMVTERQGVMDSIRRSNKLTGNARGEILGLWVAVGLAGWLGALLVNQVTSAIDVPAVTLITGPALQIVTGLADSILAVAVYQELRWIKEGGASERLAEVFA